MEKERLDEIALKVAKEREGFIREEGSYSETGVLEYEVIDFARRFLKRIDAECGKSAVGYIDSSQLDRWNRLRGTEFEVAERCYMPWSAIPFKSDISDCSTPVFLSPTPTIPEGMALVPIELLKDLDGEHLANGDCIFFSEYIAAAQGEK